MHRNTSEWGTVCADMMHAGIWEYKVLSITSISTGLEDVTNIIILEPLSFGVDFKVDSLMPEE
ncbi:hypothetical protein BGZ60DRAFT_407454 [Tricladium varicosporioides]|nr:hypothetical protein BGZ60DRAFT_407454 [Hymenoscyphus varicosporioides]